MGDEHPTTPPPVIPPQDATPAEPCRELEVDQDVDTINSVDPADTGEQTLPYWVYPD